MLLKNKRFIIKAIKETTNFKGIAELWIHLQDSDDLTPEGLIYAHYNCESAIGTNNNHEYDYIKESIDKELRLTILIDPRCSSMHLYCNAIILYCDALVIPLNNKCERLFINADREIDYRSE